MRTRLRRGGHAIGRLLSPGAGTRAVKGVISFPGAGSRDALVLLAAYAVAATAVAPPLVTRIELALPRARSA